MFHDGHLIGKAVNATLDLSKLNCEEDLKILENKLRGRDL
jgi:hypothetical protein